MKFNPLKDIGPGILIASAFIGPGTITVCTKAGIDFGYSLIWALIISIIATIILQGMAARLGLIYKNGLATAIKQELKHPFLKWFSLLLIIAAILIGNSAYQAGNISGGVLGLSTIFPNTQINFAGFDFNYLILILSFIAFVILYIGQYKWLEKIFVLLVLLMSLSFVITVILIQPDIGIILHHAFVPSQPTGSILTIIGLIGTTVVPYNLFLHASIVREKWHNPNQLHKVRLDTLLSLTIGGIVSISVVICAATFQGSSLNSLQDLAKGLTPLYGKFASILMGIGMFSAGITSAITAPLAAAYVAKGCFGWTGDLKSIPFRATWMTVLFVGTAVALVGKKPIEIIYFAQIANGLLLPLMIVFLLWISNKVSIMGKFKNNRWQNFAGLIILSFSILLFAKTIAQFL
jgi:manganese transport protein